MLVDRSYSMGYADRWKRALDAARAATGDLAGNDRATIVFFANDPVAATEPTADRARLDAAIAHAKLSSEGTRYEPALKLAAQVLSASNLPRKEVVMISDFQRVAWGAARRRAAARGHGDDDRGRRRRAGRGSRRDAGVDRSRPRRRP